jgi:CCR4-NOT transcription complex subunit 1
MSASETPEIIKYFVSNMSNKKNFKSMTAMIAQSNESQGEAFEYKVLFAVVDSIDWREILDGNTAKESNKLSFLARSIKNLCTKRNFPDFFAPAFAESANKKVWIANFREIMRLLKLSSPNDVVICHALATSSDEGCAQFGIEQLCTFFSEVHNTQKTAELPNHTAVFIAELVKDRWPSFSDHHPEFLSFLEKYIGTTRDPRSYPLIAVGEPRLSPQEAKPSPPEIRCEKEVPLKDLLREAGPSIVNPSNMRALLRDIQNLRELELLKCIIMMIEENSQTDKKRDKIDLLLAEVTNAFMYEEIMRDQSVSKKVGNWDIEQFLRFTNEVFGKKIQYDSVILGLCELSDDYASFFENRKNSQNLFQIFWFLRKQYGLKVPMGLFLLRWNSSLSKAYLLLNIIESSEPETFFLNDFFPTRISSSELGGLSTPNISRELGTGWTSKELVTAVIEMSDLPTVVQRLRVVVDPLLKNYVEVLFYVLISINPKKGINFYRDLVKNCLVIIFNSSIAMVSTVEVFYNINKKFFVSIMAELNETENNFIFLSKILDFSQTTKNFQSFFLSMSQSENHYFSISLALLAIKREFLRLENWMESNMKTGQLHWIEEFMRYLNRNIFSQLRESASKKRYEEVLEKSQLTINNLAIIFENYLFNASQYMEISQVNADKIRAIYDRLVKLYPELNQASIKQPDAKANEMLEKLYFDKYSIDDFINQVHRLKNSARNRDTEILSCILINLMNEYRYFKDFPEKELQITADVYGKMIKHRIVDGRSQIIFLKGLTDCLDMQGQMFEFGIRGLSHFITDLDLNLSSENYKMLFANERVREHHHELLHELYLKLDHAGKLGIIPDEHIRALNRVRQANTHRREVLEPGNADDRRYPEKTLMEFLLKTYNESIRGDGVSESDMEALNFVLNSLTPSRSDNTEFDRIINDRKLTLRFSKLLVYKRVPTENSLHNLYAKLVYKSMIKGLYQTVYRDSMVMLNQVIDFVNMRDQMSVEEKNCMKFCGKWVGQITFGLNRPIQLRHLNFKKKVLEAVERKKVMNIISLLCAFLSSIDDSEFFKPRIPCVNALIDLLREVNQLPTTPQTCKVFVEVLNNDLKVRAGEIHEFKWLSRHLPPDRRNLPAVTDDIGSHIRIDLGKMVENDHNGKFHNDLRQMVTAAIEASLNDVRQAIINRTLKNTLETTKMLVFKDFCIESDENKLITAVQSMITNLTWNLAMITCKEPLRVNILKKLDLSLSIQTNMDENTRKLLCNSLVSSNLEVAVSLLKKKVIEISLKEVEEDREIQAEIAKRKQARESKTRFINENFQKLQRDLPKLLKPRLDCGDLECVDIYNNPMPNAFEILPAKVEPVVAEQPAAQVSAQPPTGEDEIITHLVGCVDQELKNPTGAEQLVKFEKALQLLTQTLTRSKNSEALAVQITVKILPYLLQKEPNLAVEIILCCQSKNPKITSLVSKWLFETNAYTNPDLIIVLLQKSLLNYQEFDDKFSQKLLDWNPQAIICISEVLKQIVLHVKIFELTSFPKIVRKIQTTGRQERLNTLTEDAIIFVKNVCNYLEEQSQYNMMKLNMINMESQFEKLTSHVREYFEKLDANIFRECTNFLKDWTSFRSINEANLIIQKVKKAPYFEEEKELKMFFSYLVDICVSKCFIDVGNAPQNFTTLDYTYIDALSRFFIVLASSFKEDQAKNDSILEAIIITIIITLTKQHNFETDLPFNSKPYFRLLNNIMVECEKQSSVSRGIIFIQALKILHPIKYPRFAFAWLNLISSKLLLNFLNTRPQEVMNEYTQLFLYLITFYKDIFTPKLMERQEIRMFYVGTVRLLLVLQNDYPHFICENVFVFLEEMPSYLKHMRNIVLSTYPSDMKLPIPFSAETQNIISSQKFRSLPPLNGRIEIRVRSYNIFTLMVSYIKNKSQDDLQAIINSFYNQNFNGTSQIVLPLLRSFVYSVPQVVYSYQNLAFHIFNGYREQSIALFANILKAGHYELNDKMINAIMDNLTYPNQVTFYFTQLIVHLLNQSQDDRLIEQILKNLFERLIIDKPHPWGLLQLLYIFIANCFSTLCSKPLYQESKLIMDEMVKLAFKCVDIKQVSPASNS